MMRPTHIQVTDRRDTAPLPLVSGHIDATGQSPSNLYSLLPIPPSTPLTSANELNATTSSANRRPPQMTMLSTQQHLPSEANALGLDISGTSQGQHIVTTSALGGLNMLTLRLRTEAPCESMLFGTTSQTGLQAADTGIFPFAALRGKTTKNNTTDTAAASNTEPLELSGGLLHPNDEGIERNKEETDDVSDEGIGSAFIEKLSTHVYPSA